MIRWSLAFGFVLALGCLPACDGDGVDDGDGAGAEGGSGGTDSGGYHPSIEPHDFSSSIDNPFLPWRPGMVLTYVEDETDTIVVSVSSETKTVLGVDCVVVHDELTDEEGVTVEDTYDWYAQDNAGNVWYFGEDTTEYDADGTPSHAGSWEAGVDGALPGVVMPAEAVVGAPYRQEYKPGEAEDMGQIIAVDVDVTVPAGTYSGCLVTKDWSALTPDRDVENKVYCPGVGNVKAEVVEGGSGLEELTGAVIP
jgi:hypothetical protein